jgi:hypothetical protein
MSTDAILTSKKKKLWCDVDRLDSWNDNRPYKKGQGSLEGEYGKPAGVSPDEAIEIATYNLEHNSRLANDYWLHKGIQFLKTLDKDDVVIMYNDSYGDEHLRIVYAEGQRDGTFPVEYEDEETRQEFEPYADWREWKDEEDNE